MLTAATILAETNGFELFKSLMFDVVERESGTSTGKTKYQATVILDEYYLCQPL
jgi:hypothetical protein